MAECLVFERPPIAETLTVPNPRRRRVRRINESQSRNASLILLDNHSSESHEQRHDCQNQLRRWCPVENRQNIVQVANRNRQPPNKFHDELYDEVWLYSRPLSSYYSSTTQSTSFPGSSQPPAPDERAERSNPWQHWALRIGDTFYEAYRDGNRLGFRWYGERQAYHDWGWRSQHIEKYLGRTKLTPYQVKQRGKSDFQEDNDAPPGL